jgi:hypothetical protein
MAPRPMKKLLIRSIINKLEKFPDTDEGNDELTLVLNFIRTYKYTKNKRK